MRKMILVVAATLLAASARAQGVDRQNVSSTFTATAASGARAFACAVNGARIDFGAGTSDYASSDGTTITFAGPIAADTVASTYRIRTGEALRFTTSGTLPTCAAGVEGDVQRQAGGTSTARTKLCLCTSDGAASPTYAWKNISVSGGTEASTIGNASTCP